MNKNSTAGSLFGVPPAPADRRARTAVSAVFLVMGAAFGGWAPHIPDLRDHLGISDGVLGFCLLASAFGGVSTMGFSNVFIHRFGSRMVATVGGLAMLAIMPFLILAPSLPAFVAMYYAMGVCMGELDVGMNAHSLVVQRGYDRPILSLVHGWFSIGGFLGGAGAALAAKLNVTPFQHLSVASIVLALILAGGYWGMLPNEVDAGEEGGGSFALPHGPLIALGIFAAFSFVAEGALWDWAAVYVRDNLRRDATVQAIGSAAIPLGMAFGRIIGDPIVAALGYRRSLRYSAVLSVLGVAVALAVPSPVAFVAGFGIAGLGLANLVPVLFASAGDQPGIQPSHGLAAVTACGYAGLLTGPATVGNIAHVSSLTVAFSVIASLCAVIAILGPKYVREMRVG